MQVRKTNYSLNSENTEKFLGNIADNKSITNQEKVTSGQIMMILKNCFCYIRTGTFKINF